MTLNSNKSPIKCCRRQRDIFRTVDIFEECDFIKRFALKEYGGSQDSRLHSHAAEGKLD